MDFNELQKLDVLTSEDQIEPRVCAFYFTNSEGEDRKIDFDIRYLTTAESTRIYRKSQRKITEKGKPVTVDDIPRWQNGIFDAAVIGWSDLTFGDCLDLAKVPAGKKTLAPEQIAAPVPFLSDIADERIRASVRKTFKNILNANREFGVFIVTSATELSQELAEKEEDLKKT